MRHKYIVEMETTGLTPNEAIGLVHKGFAEACKMVDYASCNIKFMGIKVMQ